MQLVASRSQRDRSQVVEEALRSYLGLGVVDEVWRSSELSEAEALTLADEEKHAAQRIAAGPLTLRATLCHTVDVSVRELRNHTSRVSASDAREPAVLTVHGRPVADIIPRRVASERRPSDLLVADLNEISERAAEPDAADFDVGWTTDDLLS